MILLETSMAAMYLYISIAGICAAACGGVCWVWWQVGGMRGAMLIVMLLMLTLIASASAWLHTEDQAIFEPQTIINLQRWFWLPIPIAAIILYDQYASFHNDHRSWSRKSFEWYKSLTEKRENQRRQYEQQQQEAAAARSHR